MKYNVGDHVRIKSLDWYNKNKDNYGGIYAGNGFGFWKNMTRHCGEIMKITTVKVDPEDSNKGFYFMENSDEKWTDEMFEGLVEEEIIDIDDFQDDNEIIDVIDEYVHRLKNNECQINLPEGYQFTDENGNVINATKIVLEKKKKEYPKTYDECCKVLGYDDRETYCICHTYANEKLFESLYRLKVCRDAYWKIAGEEMGLGKPWVPDWAMYSGLKHCIIYSDNEIKWRCKSFVTEAKILAFPTKEMRDAFYENFKEEIESCKELL